MQIKHCPFCGYHATLESYQVRKGYEADIHCDDCLAEIHTITYDTLDEAINEAVKRWNRRVENV